MKKVPYSKTALSYADQLQQLKDRGLIIEDESKALHLLEAISYYRLSGYWYPLLADTQ
jgi:abortive infection bacteriophage resistance protein